MSVQITQIRLCHSCQWVRLDQERRNGDGKTVQFPLHFRSYGFAYQDAARGAGRL